MPLKLRNFPRRVSVGVHFFLRQETRPVSRRGWHMGRTLFKPAAAAADQPFLPNVDRDTPTARG